MLTQTVEESETYPTSVLYTSKHSSPSLYKLTGEVYGIAFSRSSSVSGITLGLAPGKFRQGLRILHN